MTSEKETPDIKTAAPALLVGTAHTVPVGPQQPSSPAAIASSPSSPPLHSPHSTAPPPLALYDALQR